jgi:hypothetical protein
MGYHSADYTKDWRIDLVELLRVVGFNNVNYVITGNKSSCYKVDPGSIDGFAVDPTRDPSAPVTLSNYHSADYNRDGRIDNAELDRVIQLYNYRYTNVQSSGTVRTGQYHDNCPGTLDGFGLGPVYLSSYNFDAKHLPTINTNWVPNLAGGGNYILRAKFLATANGDVQTTSTLNNNGLQLDSIPDPGVYQVSLYWLQYDLNGNLLYQGEEQIVTVSVDDAVPDCNNQNNRSCICGPDEQVQDEDNGQCFPYRTKRSCNAPALPEPPCNDSDYYTIYDPSSPTKFKVVAKLLDSACEPITDSNDNPILTTLS